MWIHRTQGIQGNSKSAHTCHSGDASMCTHFSTRPTLTALIFLPLLPGFATIILISTALASWSWLVFHAIPILHGWDQKYSWRIFRPESSPSRNGEAIACGHFCRGTAIQKEDSQKPNLLVSGNFHELCVCFPSLSRQKTISIYWLYLLFRFLGAS